MSYGNHSLPDMHLEQCFSAFTVHRNLQGILVTCRLESSSSGGFCISSKLPQSLVVLVRGPHLASALFAMLGCALESTRELEKQLLMLNPTPEILRFNWCGVRSVYWGCGSSLELNSEALLAFYVLSTYRNVRALCVENQLINLS